MIGRQEAGRTTGGYPWGGAGWECGGERPRRGFEEFAGLSVPGSGRAWHAGMRTDGAVFKAGLKFYRRRMAVGGIRTAEPAMAVPVVLCFLVGIAPARRRFWRGILARRGG